MNINKKITAIRTSAILLVCYFLQMSVALSQIQVYDDFEGKKLLSYHTSGGSSSLDTAAKNPSPDGVNNTEKCAKYTRDKSKKFDNIKMNVLGKLTDVSEYATYTGIPPKIKLKIYSSAPIGTKVEILLGRKGHNNEYPKGTNSQYQAYTTKQNAWEILEFKFSQIPQESETSTTAVDQIALLFNPNTSTADTYYFDDLTGPSVVSNKSEPAVTPQTNSKKTTPQSSNNK